MGIWSKHRRWIPAIICAGAGRGAGLLSDDLHQVDAPKKVVPTPCHAVNLRAKETDDGPSRFRCVSLPSGFDDGFSARHKWLGRFPELPGATCRRHPRCGFRKLLRECRLSYDISKCG